MSKVQLHVVAAALALLTAGLVAGQQPPPAPYTVVTRTGRQPLPVRLVGAQEMFAIDDLARLFGLTFREDTLAGGLVVTVNSQTIVLSPQQPLASVSGRMISLPAAPAHEGRSWFVPVDFVARALAPIAGQRLELRKPSRLVLFGDVRMPRIAARAESLGSVTRVTIDIAPPAGHSVAQDGTRLLVRFEADALDLGDLRVTPGDVVQAIHAGDAPSVLAIDLGPRYATFRAADQPTGSPASARIVIDLTAQTDTAAPTGAAPPPPLPTPGTPDTPPLLDLPPPGGLRTIVIDPGHGGEDAGSKGTGGTLEKNVVLSIARRLKASLEARLGIRVLLTREGDVNVPIDQRAALANNNKADLFLSIHANASLRPAVAGAEVMALSLQDYGEAAQRARAAAESLPVLGGGSRDIEVIPWDLAQARYVEQSIALSRSLEAALREHVPMHARALQQAPLRVLVGANMPAALVEVGFLTNAGQEKQLAGEDLQNTIAQALMDGILRFRNAAAGAPR